MSAAPAATAAVVAPESRPAQWRKTLARLFARKIVLMSAIVLLFIAATAVFYPLMTESDPNEMNISMRLHAPSWAHWAGNDELGRDVMQRIIYGARYSLMIGFFTALARADTVADTFDRGAFTLVD